jgi:hypothetical protein
MGAGFYLTGTLSLLYCALFWIGYRDPSQSKRLTSEERTYIVGGGSQAGFIFESTGSFAANFLLAGAILVLCIVRFLLLLGRIEQIQQPEIGQEVGQAASTN